jgi:hypothetical protein
VFYVYFPTLRNLPRISEKKCSSHLAVLVLQLDAIVPDAAVTGQTTKAGVNMPAKHSTLTRTLNGMHWKADSLDETTDAL